MFLARYDYSSEFESTANRLTPSLLTALLSHTRERESSKVLGKGCESNCIQLGTVPLFGFRTRERGESWRQGTRNDVSALHG